MRIIITRPTVAAGNVVGKDTTLDLPDKEANYLVNLKKAIMAGPADLPENREKDLAASTSTRKRHKAADSADD